MAIYHFKDHSIIDEITFVTTEKGGVRGYLHANSQLTPTELHGIIKNLRDKGMEVVPFMLGEKPTLEVRGFKSRHGLVQTLKGAGALRGDPKIEQLPEDKLSLMDQFRQRSLQIGGWSCLLGDYGYWTYNAKEADRMGLIGSFFYFLGTMALVGYGRNDQSDLQVHDAAKSLQQFLEREKIRLPERSSMHAIATDKKETTLEKLNEFAQRYPSEMYNSTTAMAGVFVAASAWKKMHFKPTVNMDAKAIRELYHEGMMDFGLGSITTASGVLATLVKEKKPDPDDPPAYGLDKVWQKIQEHPLAISGGGYMVASGCHAGSTFKAWREAKRVNDHARLASVPRRALFVGANLFAELLLTISSKGHGEGVTSDDSVDKSTYAIAAELIVRQPREEREWHIQHIAGFLQQPNEMAQSYDMVEAELRKQVALLEKNPWVEGHETQAAQAPGAPQDKAIPSPLMHPASISIPDRGMAHAPA